MKGTEVTHVEQKGEGPQLASLSWALLTPGNAAVILRSRLKVRVVKEPRDKKRAIHNGLSENGLDPEGGKQAMQYQVCGDAPSKGSGWGALGLGSLTPG